VADTASRLVDLAAAQGMKVFAVIDQRAEAQHVGMALRDTVLVLFGSPAAGTPIMQASLLAALDLPLRVLIWSDDLTTKVTYYSPHAIAARHHLTPDLAMKLEGLDRLTDTLVAQ
jgi:uncharacterized protein (DUF302 family)